MKQLTVLILLSAGILCSCEETDPEISVVDYLVIGDINATAHKPDTISCGSAEFTSVPPPFSSVPPTFFEFSGISGSCTTYSLLDLDLDSDGNYDFRFRHASGPYWKPEKSGFFMLCLAEIWSIECLSSGSRINCLNLPDSTDQNLYPAILECKDTLKVQSDWFFWNNHWSATSGTSPIFPLVVHYHPYLFFPISLPAWCKSAPQGDWYDAENKYIGVMLEKKNGVYLGWIKVSVFNSGIVVHEMGSKKLN